jgi:hypothetical protein
MRYNPQFHDKAHFVKALLGKLEWIFHRPPANGLWVLNYHGTPLSMMEEFKAQFNWLKRYYSFVSPDDFEGMMSGTKPISGRQLLLTFDDGLKNNLHVARFLHQQGVAAYFFVVPAFIDCPIEEQANYYATYIRPNPPAATHPEAEDCLAMSREDLLQLQTMGHRIAAHTYTHSLVAAESNEGKSRREVAEVKNYLGTIGIEKVSSFCSINNSLESVGALEKKLIAENYQYHFTTLPGNNAAHPDPLFIKRMNVEVHWLKGAMQYALGSWDLKRWESKLQQYEAIPSGK